MPTANPIPVHPVVIMFVGCTFNAKVHAKMMKSLDYHGLKLKTGKDRRAGRAAGRPRWGTENWERLMTKIIQVSFNLEGCEPTPVQWTRISAIPVTQIWCIKGAVTFGRECG